MPKFFCEGFSNDKNYISGEDASHIIRSLRMKRGEQLYVNDLAGRLYDCVISDMSDDTVYLDILKECNDDTEPDVNVTLFQCLTKGDKFEGIVQKCVELGVKTIVPVLSSRCVSRPDAKSLRKKIERYNKISLSAAKQSGRGCIPEIKEALSFGEMCQELKRFDSAVFFYEGGGDEIGNAVKGENIAVIIGPEGGFDVSEVQKAKENGAVPATLGKRILRTETAPIAALSVIMYITGNMK